MKSDSLTLQSFHFLAVLTGQIFLKCVFVYFFAVVRILVVA